MDFFHFLALVIVISPISLFIHEWGHVIGAKFIHAEYIKLSIGMGKPLCRLLCFRNVIIEVNQIFFLGASTESKRNKPLLAKDHILISFMGPLVSLIVAILCYYLAWFLKDTYLYLTALFNLWLSIINSIPFKFGRRQSDGYTILKWLLKYTKYKL